MTAGARAQGLFWQRGLRAATAWVERESWSLGLLVVGLGAAPIVGALVASGNSEIALMAALAIPLMVVVLRWPIAAIVIYLLVVPFFVSRPTAELGPVLWALHRLMAPATLIVLGIYHALGIRHSPFRRSFIDVLLIVFIVAGAANVFLLASNPIRMVMSFYDKLIIPIAIFWLVRAVGVSRRDITWLALVGMFAVGVQASIGVLSWLAPSALPDQWLGRAGERTVGTFGGPAPYTITLVFFALLLVYLLIRERFGLMRSLVPAFLVLALLGIFLSLSRGSWLGAAVAAGGLAIMYPRQSLRFVAIGVVLTAVALGGPLASPAGVAGERLEDSDTITSRLITNEAAVRMIESRPFSGFGFGNFERYDEGFKRRSDDFALKLGGSSHNTYLNMAAELGVPLGALWASVPAWLLVRSIRERRRVRAMIPAALPLLPLLWLALADQFVVSNFLEMVHAYPWGTVLWCLTLGLIATILDDAASRRRHERDRTHDLVARPAMAW
jgi:O-antigen ligase